MPQGAILILATAMRTRHGDGAIMFVDHQLETAEGDSLQQWIAVRALLAVWVLAAATLARQL